MEGRPSSIGAVKPCLRNFPERRASLIVLSMRDRAPIAAKSSRRFGEDVSEKLKVVSTEFKVIEMRQIKYARSNVSCDEGIKCVHISCSPFSKSMATRSKKVPKRTLQGYKGFLQVNGYGGYNNAISACAEVTRKGCVGTIVRCRLKDAIEEICVTLNDENS